jgi:hypothetical protein
MTLRGLDGAAFHPTISEFLVILAAYQVGVVSDVRRFRLPTPAAGTDSRHSSPRSTRPEYYTSGFPLSEAGADRSLRSAARPGGRAAFRALDIDELEPLHDFACAGHSCMLCCHPGRVDLAKSVGNE